MQSITEATVDSVYQTYLDSVNISAASSDSRYPLLNQDRRSSRIVVTKEKRPLKCNQVLIPLLSHSIHHSEHCILYVFVPRVSYRLSTRVLLMTPEPKNITIGMGIDSSVSPSHICHFLALLSRRSNSCKLKTA